MYWNIDISFCYVGQAGLFWTRGPVGSIPRVESMIRIAYAVS